MKKIYLLIICLFTGLVFIGCNTSKANMQNLYIGDNQTLSNEDKNKITKLLNSLDTNINSFEKLALEFKENYNKYSKEDFENYIDRVNIEIKNINDFKSSLVNNPQLSNIYYISHELSESFNSLNASAQSFINKETKIGISRYNYTIERMNATISYKNIVKEEIIKN